VVKNIGGGVKTHFTRIEPQDNYISVILVGKALDHIEISIKYIITKIIRFEICA